MGELYDIRRKRHGDSMTAQEQEHFQSIEPSALEKAKLLALVSSGEITPEEYFAWEDEHLSELPVQDRIEVTDRADLIHFSQMVEES